MSCSGETYPNGIVTTRSPRQVRQVRRWSSAVLAERGLRAAGVLHPPGDHGVDDGADLVVGEAPVAVDRDGRDDGEEPAGEVGAARGGVLVGGVVERLDRAEHGVGDREVLAP